MSNRIVIRKTNHIVDIFFGEFGFDSKHWTRMTTVKTKEGIFLKYLKGARISQQDMIEVHKILGV